jgi:hypothetical protein
MATHPPPGDAIVALIEGLVKLAWGGRYAARHKCPGTVSVGICGNHMRSLLPVVYRGFFMNVTSIVSIACREWSVNTFFEPFAVFFCAQRVWYTGCGPGERTFLDRDGAT